MLHSQIKTRLERGFPRPQNGYLILTLSCIYATSVAYDKMVTLTLGVPEWEGSLMINTLLPISNWELAILAVGLIQLTLLIATIFICSTLRLYKTLIVLVTLGVTCNLAAGSTWLYQVEWYILFANHLTQFSIIPVGILFFTEYIYKNWRETKSKGNEDQRL